MPATNPITLLVIDDNDVDRTAIRRLLQEDFEILEAATAKEGTALLDQKEIDCVVLDYRLPDTDGVDLLPELQDKPVILLTGEGSTDVAVEALKSGACDYLTKRQLDRFTLRRAVEAAITRKQLERRLATAQRMEGIGRLAGGVAHDFNNMLMAMIGHLELAREAIGDDHVAAGHLDTVMLAAQRSAELTRGLMAFGRQLQLRPSVVDVAAVVHEASALLARTLSEDIELVLHAPMGVGITAVVDVAQLQQSILNLALNARNAMPEGGRLTVEVTRETVEDLPADWQVDGLPPGDYVCLAVSDTGHGIPAAIQGKVFEPFFTTRPEGEGSGLGLAGVHGFVGQSGGRVQLYSEEGVGTTLKLYLPAAAPDDPAAREPERPAAPARTGTECVLVVEDEEMIRELIEEVLSRAGYDVVVAKDGETACRIAEEAPGRFDLVLSDVVLPGMGGAETMERVRESQPAAKAVFMSGYTAPASSQRAGLAPDAAFLPKPVRPAQLRACIRGVLDGAGTGDPKADA